MIFLTCFIYSFVAFESWRRNAVERDGSRLFHDRFLSLCTSTPSQLLLLMITIIIIFTIIIIVIIINSREIMWVVRETHVRCRRIHKKFGRKTWKEKRLWRPRLRCLRITKKWNVKMLSGLILLRTGINDGHLRTRKWTIGFHKATHLQWVIAVNHTFSFFFLTFTYF